MHTCLLQAKTLSSEVADLFRNVLRLHLKMNRNRVPGREQSSSSSTGAESLGSEAEDESLEAAELTELNPQQLSFWIAHAFTVSRLISIGLQGAKPSSLHVSHPNVVSVTA